VTDRLAPFGQAVLAVRWGVLALSLALSAADLGDRDAATWAAFGVLVLWTGFRVLRPLRHDGARAVEPRLLLEAVIAAGVVVTTGHGDSPLVFALVVPAALAGFAGGFRLGLGLAVVTVLAVGASWAVVDDVDGDRLEDSADWAGEVLLVGFVAGYARRISGEADERREAALSRLGRLSDANVLLFQLHQVTQTLPASLDLTEVLDVTVEQLRDLFEVDGVAILLFEESDGAWHAARRHGIRTGTVFTPGELPAPVTRAVAVRSTDREDDLAPPAGPGLDPRSRSGLYGVLTARGATIGLIALEDSEPSHFTERDVELLGGFVDAAALAVDNARWFGRLRTLGADEERGRIAKDLHDRTGQSLAYLAFELDRISKRASQGKEVAPAIDALRNDVRKVVGELRDTLYDLRTDVTEADGLASTLRAFLDRVQERSGLQTELIADEAGRLPLLREREIWRLAREALANVEQHAQASSVVVTWRCDGHRAELEVRDDGIGWSGAEQGAGPPGLAVLRERAASIGATLAVTAEPGRGTRVRCTVAG
jgi:signal transduction histidine kinase